VFFEVLPNGKLFPHFTPESSRGCEGYPGYLPCKQCIGCRLANSRDWGLRCLHEAKMHEENSFVTLTFDDEHLAKMCPGGSLVKKHVSDFVRSLRDKMQYQDADYRVRYFACGEYGGVNSRPHYHFCLFGFDWPDKKFWCKSRNGELYYRSPLLEEFWPFGHSVIGELTFQSAAYVARYCTKKITGKKAASHYRGRQPDFALMSNKPGLGTSFFMKFGPGDIIPHGYCLLNGCKVPLPEHYDTLWERMDPDGFAQVKIARREKAIEFSEEFSHDRLVAMEKCQAARMKKLFRILEV
jgi:hypothetical protein